MLQTNCIICVMIWYKTIICYYYRLLRSVMIYLIYQFDVLNMQFLSNTICTVSIHSVAYMPQIDIVHVVMFEEIKQTLHCHKLHGNVLIHWGWEKFAVIFKCIFLQENERISLEISLKFFPKVRINNISTLLQIMAWHRQGNKSLAEPAMCSLLTHICITRPQWVKYALIKN